MTQVARQKWVLLFGGLNALFAIATIAIAALLVGHARAAAEGADLRDRELHAMRAELAAVRSGLDGMRDLRASVLELRDSWQERPAPLSQTLQLLASEEQLLLMRSLRPQPVARKSSARRLRRRPVTTACPVR